MSVKTAIITGPTSGIGKTTALALAQKGYTLILLARNREKAAALLELLGDQARADFIMTDLSDLGSVREAVGIIRQRYNRIDLLINNAGLIVDEKLTSPNGIELTFASNHVGHFLLTTEIIDLLKAAGSARIVHVSSSAHKFANFKAQELVSPPTYVHFIAYANSKLANILFSNTLSEKYAASGITSNALHPGAIASSFGGASKGLVKWFVNLGKPFFKNVEQGAQTSLYLATSPEVEQVSGRYFENSKPASTSRAAANPVFAKELWELSEELVRPFRS